MTGPADWESVNWWASPALAYAKGLADGYAVGRHERDAEDDAAWRATVRGLFAEGEGHSGRRDLDGRPLPSITAQIDRRRASDRGEAP